MTRRLYSLFFDDNWCDSWCDSWSCAEVHRQLLDLHADIQFTRIIATTDLPTLERVCPGRTAMDGMIAQRGPAAREERSP